MGFVGEAIGSVLGGITGALTPGMPTGAVRDPFTDQMLGATYDRSQQGLDLQRAYLNSLANQNALANQSNVFGQQQALANQLQGIASGTGPNPAMAQLANTTGQNIANQAAMMGGQRGANANVGLLGRQIAQQGAATQQQAVGQGAALRAQQQLAAMNALQQQQANMGNLANQQANLQANALNAYNSGAQNLYGQGLQSVAAANNARAGLAGSQMQAQGQITGGLLGGAGLAAAAALNKGGMVEEDYVDGLIKHFSGGGAVVPGKAMVAGDSLKNDTVPAMLSPKEIVLPRSVTLAPNAPDKAKAFVEAVLARKALRKK